VTKSVFQWELTTTKRRITGRIHALFSRQLHETSTTNSTLKPTSTSSGDAFSNLLARMLSSRANVTIAQRAALAENLRKRAFSTLTPAQSPGSNPLGSQRVHLPLLFSLPKIRPNPKPDANHPRHRRHTHPPIRISTLTLAIARIDYSLRTPRRTEIY
jgi:hypothetical protein